VKASRVGRQTRRLLLDIWAESKVWMVLKHDPEKCEAVFRKDHA